MTQDLEFEVQRLKAEVERLKHIAHVTGESTYRAKVSHLATEIAEAQGYVEELELKSKHKIDSLSALCEKLASALDDTNCVCTVAERASGHMIGCWRPEVDELLAEYRSYKNDPAV